MPVKDRLLVVYIAHPVSGNVEENLAAAKQWVAWAAGQGVSPVASYIPLCEVLDDADPANRELGMRCDFAVIERCDEVWLCGGYVSKGMRAEADHAERHGIPVRSIHSMTGASL